MFVPPCVRLATAPCANERPLRAIVRGTRDQYENRQNRVWFCATRPWRYWVTSATTIPVAGSTSSRRLLITMYRYDRSDGAVATTACGIGASAPASATREPTAEAEAEPGGAPRAATTGAGATGSVTIRSRTIGPRPRPCGMMVRKIVVRWADVSASGAAVTAGA